MKRNIKNVVLLLMIVTLLLGSLGGCCCYCPTCPPIEEEFQVLVEIPYCPIGLEPYTEVTKGMLNHMRDIAPEALRLGFGSSQLTDLKDALKITQKASDKISKNNEKNIYDAKPDDFIKACLFQHPKLPIGYVERQNVKDYIIAVWNVSLKKVQF